MAIGADELMQIEQLLAAEVSPSPITELRRRFPHLALTRCDASDVIEPPFRSFRHYDLHLIDGSDHCVQITPDPAWATGIVLAAKAARR
ncbi:DUF6129 family protein [Bradyrhizobium sp. ARR65]|uniref:DUF6129 family protein n=1 Tax=Bradyrhizobium sp. ARR65 TaxID=1040989 RepID=UPI000467ADC2|nr:DUF6129 family protein [Bradyrhizobium sp. ARR65]